LIVLDFRSTWKHFLTMNSSQPRMSIGWFLQTNQKLWMKSPIAVNGVDSGMHARVLVGQ
jgi:hypothetical protein